MQNRSPVITARCMPVRKMSKLRPPCSDVMLTCMGLDLCHNSELDISYFECAKVHFARVRTVVFWRSKFFERTKIYFAFKISFWMCADLLFCTFNV